MERFSVTAYIRCYKDPDLVLKCASYVKWADEILIADNSNDDSVKNVVHQIDHPKVKYIKTDIVDFRQRIVALKDEVTSDYILMIDTDEYYYESAAKEILEVLANKQDVKEGYIVPSDSYMFSTYLNGRGDNQLRLFMRDKFYFEFKSIHEMPKVHGSVGQLKNGYQHYCSPTFAQQIHKPYIYAMADAGVLSDEELQQKRVDNYSSFKIKIHFLTQLLRLIWRSRSFFFSRKTGLAELWIRYIDILVILSNDIGPTEEIRIRERRNKPDEIIFDKRNTSASGK